MNYTKQQLLEKYKKLPQAVQEAMGSEANADIVSGIGETHKLEDAQTQKITETIAYVMLGVLEAEDFVSTLKKELKVEDAIVEKIAAEISQKIFLPIREAMQSVVSSQPAPVSSTQPVEETPIAPIKESVPATEAVAGSPVPLMKKPEPKAVPEIATPPTNLPGATPVTETTDVPEEKLNREAVLREIEDAPEAPTAPFVTQEAVSATPAEKPAANFIEEKLSVPTAIPKKVVQAPPAPEVYGTDPYREPVA